jgi:TldD protein
VKRTLACLLLVAAMAAAQNDEKKPPEDVILQAMQDEIARSRSIKIPNLTDAPYYIEYGLDDFEGLTLSATLGGLMQIQRTHVRIPRVEMRVGDYKFDNTNYLFSDLFRHSGMEGDRMPLDDDPLAIRTHFWLATDAAFKGAVDSISRKRSALKNVAAPETLNDFARAQPVRILLPVKRIPADEAAWTKRAKALSAAFLDYPAVLNSGVEFQWSQVATYYANSEGTALRYPDNLVDVRIRATGQAPDGTPIHDHAEFFGHVFLDLASEDRMMKSAQQVGANVTALAAAPVAETYAGPVLFEAQAAAQLLAQMLRALAPVRKPVNEPGRNIPIPASEFEGREGSRILPEFLDVVDDPTQTEWRGQSLFGSYLVDMEGVKPVPLPLVEKGVLKNFLMTRQPVRGHEGSNGRARLPGNFGAGTAAFGNLFVKAAETSTAAELKKKLLETISKRGKPYGMLVRKLDFPSSANVEEIRKLYGGEQGPSGRVVSAPLLVYRVYPDGREELVRGLRFRGLTARSLRDITAASDEAFVFDYLENGAPLALSGGGGYVANTTVVAPSLLFDDLELERVDAEWARPPIVPAPPLVSVR